ncbi:mucosal addressin cell adhesion molecule 1 [Striga asiatica]|uniref:Mucosal addressin cell adhesion molecule 1 n=1 Tax=Striga asiatica TaxID=4170 RepID=A0A5A7QK56_STRAF|nr:mucosal addressin cell adhesion molecule 1 [Striga asiatica]
MEKVKAINRTDLVSLSRLLSSAVVVSGGASLLGPSLASHDRRLPVVAVVAGGAVLTRQAAIGGGLDGGSGIWQWLGCLLIVLIVVLIVMLVVLCGYVSSSSVDCVDVLLLNSGNLGDHFLPFAGQDILLPLRPPSSIRRHPPSVHVHLLPPNGRRSASEKGRLKHLISVSRLVSVTVASRRLRPRHVVLHLHPPNRHRLMPRRIASVSRLAASPSSANASVRCHIALPSSTAAASPPIRPPSRKLVSDRRCVSSSPSAAVTPCLHPVISSTSPPAPAAATSPHPPSTTSILHPSGGSASPNSTLSPQPPDSFTYGPLPPPKPPQNPTSSATPSPPSSKPSPITAAVAFVLVGRLITAAVAFVLTELAVLYYPTDGGSSLNRLNSSPIFHQSPRPHPYLRFHLKSTNRDQRKEIRADWRWT